MAKKKITNDYPFYTALREFYLENKKIIRKSYKQITKKILDFNDKEINPSVFLRTPQFETFEMYVFLKEFLHNEHMTNIFAD